MVQVQPWYDAQYLIPMLGMLLGNACSGIAVGLSTVLDELSTGALLLNDIGSFWYLGHFGILFGVLQPRLLKSASQPPAIRPISGVPCLHIPVKSPPPAVQTH